MKNLNTTSLMVITIVLSSVFAMPMVAVGQEKDIDNLIDMDQVDEGVFDGFRKGFARIFGTLGHMGDIIGTLFSLLFFEGLNFSSHEMLENVFVLSANVTETESGTINFGAMESKDYYYLPEDYYVPADMGYAYCEVEKQGIYQYTLEKGAAITLIIWDNDRSFINAITQLMSFFRRVIYTLIHGLPITRDFIREGVRLLTWFLIHINDIFTGDELFVLNPITWKTIDIDPSTYNIMKTWKYSGPDYKIGTGDDSLVPPGNMINWYNNASVRRDNYMEWLLTPTVPGDIAPTIWTQFTFDLIQLWVKNFEIHIDIAEFLNFAQGKTLDVSAAFGGCDIQTYLFTHHLAGAFLYNDSMPQDDKLSVNYTPLRYPNGTVIEIDSANVEVPKSSELTHRLILGRVDKFNFEKPKINANKSISWGLTLQDVNISAVPIGIALDSYLNAPQENLDYVYFGFTFEPQTDREIGAAKGVVKLDQYFTPWNNNSAPYSNADISGLDLAIIYVSTSLFFHLNIATKGEEPSDPTALLDPNQDYNNISNEVKIGNYLGGRTKLDFIDIAGEFYEFGNDALVEKANASTSIIPLALWIGEMNRHDTFVAQDGQPVETFATDISVQVEFNVMVYAICYPEFENGNGIWHDPTFSVYMIFQGEGFWALIVLIAGVGLVGVATILIKRRKDRRF
ncbi:MAG: hypothetical protein ACFFBV_01030 [Promethearchaeota archaeon]